MTASKDSSSDDEESDKSDSDSSNKASTAEDSDDDVSEWKKLVKLQSRQIRQLQLASPPKPSRRALSPPDSTVSDPYADGLEYVVPTTTLSRKRQLKALGLDANGRRLSEGSKKTKEKVKPASKLDYKRVNQLWDKKTHQFKLSDTAEDADTSIYDQYVFNVRRTFNWEGEYRVRTFPTRK